MGEIYVQQLTAGKKSAEVGKSPYRIIIMYKKTKNNKTKNVNIRSDITS